MTEQAEGRYFKPKVLFRKAAEGFLEYSKSRKRSHKADIRTVAVLVNEFGNRALDALTPDAVENFRFHDLRHCAVTNFRKAGVPQNVIMSISGHKTDVMLRRYDKVDREDRLAALDRVRKECPRKSKNQRELLVCTKPKKAYSSRFFQDKIPSRTRSSVG